jgi:phosphatidylethanolamine/phosphatidyl-N-methylethanolamine N-methyltransferase
MASPDRGIFPDSVEEWEEGRLARLMAKRCQKLWGSWMSVRDHVLFLRDWVCDPLQVAAIAPSSLSLAHIITSEISFCDAPVMELGPGTGVFTRRLTQKGIPQENLVLVERSEGFADLLERRFPRARIIRNDAEKLVANEHVVSDTMGAVISGLPLAIMPARKVITIMRFAFECLNSGSFFYQFTYGQKCPIAPAILDRCGLSATHIGHTFLNVPPASVYRIFRKSEED